MPQPAPERLADRVRRRLRAAMTRQRLSQHAVADRLAWSQSRVAQKLNPNRPSALTLDELEALAHAVGVSVVALVADEEHTA